MCTLSSYLNNVQENSVVRDITILDKAMTIVVGHAGHSALNKISS